MGFPARFPSVCAACSRPITVGETIERHAGTTRYRHTGCLDPDPLPGLAAASADPAVAATAQITDGTRVWTDGACSGNPGPGGWAWATSDGRRASGGEAPSTNQRMEIRAALEAVRALPGPLRVVSDSTYVVNCFRDSWWRGWLARGWTTSAKKPVANRDLWEPLITAVRDRGDVSFEWVKGHSGDEMNDLVDGLAVAAARAAAGA